MPPRGFFGNTAMPVSNTSCEAHHCVDGADATSSVGDAPFVVVVMESDLRWASDCSHRFGLASHCYVWEQV
jgi:hypothetical protein